eukprot:CAMPEP_0170882600 /NCGR_PEP_ID=MMETSP0734-20130129/33796_1 /TAXON_ID=186038 /ORGANISM="Fragilariopsis kerguelensis, Strain L26-C5" /LENGTH=93 /DNA_ID=CAMNT_0011266683 /DNA_START=247 /DNA_END=528 /DNA_ORIENTATION=-
MTFDRLSSSYLHEVLSGFLVLDIARKEDSEEESDDDDDDDDDDSELKHVVDGIRVSLVVATLLYLLLLLSSSFCGSFISVSIIEEYTTLVMIQ